MVTRGLNAQRFALPNSSEPNLCKRSNKDQIIFDPIRTEVFNPQVSQENVQNEPAQIGKLKEPCDRVASTSQLTNIVWRLWSYYRLTFLITVPLVVSYLIGQFFPSVRMPQKLIGTLCTPMGIICRCALPDLFAPLSAINCNADYYHALCSGHEVNSFPAAAANPLARVVPATTLTPVFSSTAITTFTTTASSTVTDVMLDQPNVFLKEPDVNPKDSGVEVQSMPLVPLNTLISVSSSTAITTVTTTASSTMTDVILDQPIVFLEEPGVSPKDPGIEVDSIPLVPSNTPIPVSSSTAVTAIATTASSIALLYQSNVFLNEPDVNPKGMGVKVDSISPYSSPQYLLPDFGLAEGGAKVISGLTSPTEGLAPLSYAAGLLAVLRGYDKTQMHINPPLVVLEEQLSVSNCWKFSGSQGHIAVSLSDTIIWTQFTLHFPDHLDASSSRLEQAPKILIMWALVRKSEVEVENVRFLTAWERFVTVKQLVDSSVFNSSSALLEVARILYRPSTGGRQTFSTQIPVETSIVLIEVVDNWGDPSTCIHRISFHSDSHKEDV